MSHKGCVPKLGHNFILASKVNGELITDTYSKRHAEEDMETIFGFNSLRK